MGLLQKKLIAAATTLSTCISMTAHGGIVGTSVGSVTDLYDFSSDGSSFGAYAAYVVYGQNWLFGNVTQLSAGQTGRSEYPLSIYFNTNNAEDLANTVNTLRIDYYANDVTSVQLDGAAYASGTDIALTTASAYSAPLCFLYGDEAACLVLSKDADSDTWDGFTVTDWIRTSLADLQGGIIATGLATTGVLLNSGTLVNGAHSRPMSRRVAVGDKTYWAAGDWGIDQHGSRDGHIGLAEFGMGYNYGPAQVNLSLGYVGSDQKLINAGEAEHRGKYVMVEGLIPLNSANNMVATLGAYGQWGSLDTRRGFDNAGTIEYSTGDTDTHSWGLRARIDWENAFSASTTRFSPYVDLWYGKTRVDGYTETGGSFPVSYNKTEDSLTDLRLGVNSQTPMSDKFNLIANLEAAHRFDNKAGTTSGTAGGLGAFSFAGQEYDQNWLKAGLGVEGQLGEGKVSMMLNGTTEGEMPSTWLAVSYQMTF